MRPTPVAHRRDPWPAGPVDVRLPDSVVGLVVGFRDGLVERLGDGLVSLFLHGALAFPRPATWLLDVDFHALLGRPVSSEERDGVRRLHGELAQLSPIGNELDGYYLLASDARVEQRPVSVVWPAVDKAWALHRAHIHAGRFFLLCGEDPRRLLPAASWKELEADLNEEMAYVVAHPEHPAFGVLNACRVLWSLRTREIVVSKFAAACWGAEELPAWRSLLEAAVKVYMQTASDAEHDHVRDGRARFIEFVRDATGMPR